MVKPPKNVIKANNHVNHTVNKTWNMWKVMCDVNSKFVMVATWTCDNFYNVDWRGETLMYVPTNDINTVVILDFLTRVKSELDLGVNIRIIAQLL